MLGVGNDQRVIHAVQRNRAVERHPDTGRSVVGMRVPYWGEVLRLSRRVAEAVGLVIVPLPSGAYMSGGGFSEKDGREVPDTIAVTLDFPQDIVVTWQSTFSNKHYGLGDRILGSDGTLEHHFEERLQYWPEKINRPSGEDTKGSSPNQDHMGNWIDCIRNRKAPNAPPEIGYRSAIAVHMANLSYKNKRRLTLEEAKAIMPEH